MSLQEFFYKYFIYPAKNLSGYNLINTLTYAIIFVIAMDLIYELLERLRVKIDNKMTLYSLPYILFGVFYRLQVDFGVWAPNIITVTPGAWIIPAIIALSALLLEYKVGIKDAFRNVGLILWLLTLSTFTIPINNYLFFTGWLAFMITIFIALYKFSNLWSIAFLGQLTDATASYIALKNRFIEEHVLPNYLISLGGPELFFIAKVFAVILVILALEKIKIDENLRNFVYFAIFLLGFGPGTRNWFLLIYHL